MKFNAYLIIGCLRGEQNFEFAHEQLDAENAHFYALRTVTHQNYGRLTLLILRQNLLDHEILGFWRLILNGNFEKHVLIVCEELAVLNSTNGCEDQLQIIF